MPSGLFFSGGIEYPMSHRLSLRLRAFRVLLSKGERRVKARATQSAAALKEETIQSSKHRAPGQQTQTILSVFMRQLQHVWEAQASSIHLNPPGELSLRRSSLMVPPPHAPRCRLRAPAAVSQNAAPPSRKLRLTSSPRSHTAPQLRTRHGRPPPPGLPRAPTGRTRSPRRRPAALPARPPVSGQPRSGAGCGIKAGLGPQPRSPCRTSFAVRGLSVPSGGVTFVLQLDIGKNSLKMNFFLELLKVIGLSTYYMLESLVFLFVPKRKKNVSGEIVLITGAGSGIGRLLSLKFAKLGATLVLWDINQDGLQETCRLAEENGAVRIHSYICDCSKRQEVYRVADQVKKEVGDVSILVNNAGIVTGRSFIESPDSLVEKTMEVNTMAHFWTYKAFLPAMIASNHGHLVSIASSAGLIGVNRLADYCASKFAAVGFAESISFEMKVLGKTGVKTTTVCPYFINTGMFDGCRTKWPFLLPILDPDYVAEKIMTAIRRDQEILVLPRSLYFFFALKNILPVKVGILLADFAGALRFMDSFKGRAKKD